MSKDDSSSRDEKVHDPHDNVEKSHIGGSESEIEALPEVLKDGHTAQEFDVSLKLPGMLGVHDDDEVDPAESKRVKRKLDWHILPLLCGIYTLQFLDKNAIGASTILGFLTDTHLTVAHLNNLSTFFYVGNLISQLPHAWAFQKLPVAKYLATMMFFWALLVGCHAAAKNYHELIALRILLGFCEGCITPGIMLISSMFYTRMEMGERVGWAFQCNGFAQIISGFISYGAYFTPAKNAANPHRIAQWQWFMLIIALMTFVTAIVFALFFPDSPTKARFLSEHEKVIAVKRCKANQTGVETKLWKKSQFIEALKDTKIYIFMLYAVLANFVGGIGIQYSLIIKDFGFNIKQTTLLNIPSGGLMVITVTFSLLLLHRFPNARGWISALSYIPCIIAAILLIALPNNRLGLLISFYALQLGCTPAVVLSLSWISTTTSGHTKKLTHHGMWLVGYSVGQMVAPQWWQDKYKPRNRVPWAIILTSYCVQVVIILVLRWFLNRRNLQRDAAQAAATTEEEKEKFSEYGWLEVPTEDGSGKTKRVRVEKRFLDLTDFENMNFRYTL
jgi:MFS family permease